MVEISQFSPIIRGKCCVFHYFIDVLLVYNEIQSFQLLDVLREDDTREDEWDMDNVRG